MKRSIFLTMMGLVLTLAGCQKDDTVRQLPHLGDTPYQPDSILMAYATQPERALTLLDSALLLGNISDYRSQFIRAKIYSKSLEEQRLDSAIIICKALLSHDSVRNEPAKQENVLDLLISVSRAKTDYEQYMHWAIQKAELCQRQGKETERWRTETDIGLVMTHLGQEDEGLAKLDDYDTDTWLLYQQYYVYGRFSTMLRYTDYYQNIYNTIQRVKCLAPSATIDYEIAMLLKDCDTEGCREILENMRRRMSQRIDQLDWLSSATKAKAQEKLQAMVFSVGKPDILFNADFELTGSTAIESAMQYMRQFTEYQRSVDGKPAYGNGWDYLNGNVISTMNLSSVNAFYAPQFNQLFIIPAFLMPEIFPTDKNNAQRYALSMVFGHELTHGFDPHGAKYDARALRATGGAKRIWPNSNCYSRR